MLMTSAPKIAFTWGPNSCSGWGVYGSNLLLNWSRRSDLTVYCSAVVNHRLLELDQAEMLTVQPALRRSEQLARDLAPHAGKIVQTPITVLNALSRNLVRSPTAHGVGLFGAPSIGVVFTESAPVSNEARERAKEYALIIAGSRWNYDILKAAGIDHLAFVMQGVDPKYFHPAPRTGMFGDRFTVFSGGKLERRKGQDLVVRAFRIFAKRHPEALLVTAWNSPWPEIAQSVNQQPDIHPVALAPDGQVDALGWTVANGIPPHQVMHQAMVSNSQIAKLLREMDVALFPNRCEGGTNLVAMEALACGVPTILSANTGHLDLIKDENCYALQRQGAIAAHGREGWGESDIDEIVETLEAAYRDRAGAAARGRRAAADMAQLSWARQLDSLAEIVRPYQKS